MVDAIRPKNGAGASARSEGAQGGFGGFVGGVEELDGELGQGDVARRAERGEGGEEREDLAAEVELDGDVLMLADEFPELGLVGPHTRGGVSQSLHLTVRDVDAVVARAVAAGGRLDREPADTPHGRTGVVVDPAGHRWMVQQDAP